MELPVRTIKNAFTAGEWSPRLIGRSDMRDYYNSASTIKNMIVSTHGGIEQRPGTYLAGEVADHDDKTRLIPFRFSTQQNYVIELGDQYARFYRARGQVTDGTYSITGATQANPGVVTTSAPHGLSNGDQVIIDGVVGMTQLNGRTFTAANVAATTFELSGVDTTSYTAWSSDGTVYPIYEITTPWAIADVFELKFEQSADVLYVTHGDYAPREMTRTSDTSWTIAEYESGDGPYLDQNTTATTITPSATTGSITLTASASLFASTDVGRKVRLLHAGTWGYAEITSYTSPTLVNADVKSTLGGTGAVTTWRLGSWSDTTGWPEVVTLFQSRLVFANNSDQPSTIWGSKSNNFTEHAPTATDGTVADDNGINFTIASNQVNAIRWMSPGETLLLVGTSNASHKVYGGNSAGALVAVTPTNIAVGLAAEYGNAEDVRVHRVGSDLFALQNSQRVLRGLRYNARVASYEGRNSSIYAEHLLRDSIVDFDVQREIDIIGWMVRNDGLLIGFTFEQLEEVNAYHQHALGGSGVVESVAVIPSPTETQKNDIWITVKRTIDGNTRRYVEYMPELFDPDTLYQDRAFYVDSGLTYDGYQTGTLTPGATTGPGIVFTASNSVFVPSDVGLKLLVMDDGEIKSRVLITGYTSPTVVTGTIEVDFASTDPVASGTWAIAKQTLDSLWHLEGETVQAMADGADHPDMTVSNGAVTLNRFYARVHVGLGFDAEVILAPAEDPRAGTIRGTVQKISDLKVRVHKTAAFEMGQSGHSLVEVSLRDFSDPMDQAPSLFTGFVKSPFPAGFDTEKQVHLRQSRPLPFNVLMVQYNMMARD